jgi:tetratricopeptide (TPR) repeat protein
LLAQSLLGLHQHADALTSAERALTLTPDREWCHRLRSIALRKLGQPREAVAAAQQAVVLGPLVAPAHQTLSHAYREAKQGRPAWDAAMHAVRIAPNSPESHEAAGLAALQLGWTEQAEHAFRTQLGIDPTSTYARNNLGVTLERAGRRDEAMELYREAAKLEPREPMFRRNVGRLAYKRSTYRIVILGLAMVAFVFAGVFGILVAIAGMGSFYAIQSARVRRIAAGRSRGDLGVESAKLEAMRRAFVGHLSPFGRWIAGALVIALLVLLIALVWGAITSGQFFPASQDSGLVFFPAVAGAVVGLALVRIVRGIRR